MAPATKYALVGLLFAALFVARLNILLAADAHESLTTYADSTAIVRGTIADDPDVRDTGVRVTLKVATINSKAGSGNLLVVLPRGMSVAYGDSLEVRGLVELPQNFLTNTGREFDYQTYLKVRGVTAVMQHPQLRNDTPSGASVLGTLFTIKHAFEDSLEQAIPEPEVSLLEGILLGERGGFSNELLQMFVIAGLIHVVVLSGSNIAVVSEGVFRFFGAFMPRRATYILGLVTIVLFALMVGGGAATVRAVIMGAIAILARYMRRPTSAMRALLFAGALLVLWNPLYLLDQGFVLSMLATFGLITLGVSIEKYIKLLPAWTHFNLRSIVATTLAVEIFILPALLYYSGVLSLISIPANALLLPLVPFVMLLGFLAGVLGLVHPALSLVPALGAQIMLKFLLWAVQIVAALPHAAVLVATFPAWIAVLAYLPLTLVAFRIYSRTRTS